MDYWDGVTANLCHALLMGVRFDTVISCYILALPSLLWLIFYCIDKKSLFLNRFLHWYISIFFSIAFAVCAFDIPYFKQFFSRLDKSAFLWLDNPKFILEMVSKDFSLWGFSIPFLILLWIFHKFLNKIFVEINQLTFVKQKYCLKIISSLFFLALTFIGIRGRLETKSPIRVGTAFFSDNAFLNKIGLNPNFTLLNSLMQKDIKWENLIATDKAFSIIKKEYRIDDRTNAYSISRKMNPENPNFGKPNIVVVLMESMTADNMAFFGNSKKLTPVLDSLVSKSIFFENAYSEGIHTFNGIYGTLFSFPALWNEHPMKTIKNYNGFTNVLRKEGYKTNFFMTHDDQFDNVGGFLFANNFNKIYSQKDYPISEIHSNLGVSDDYLFRFSIDKINRLYQEKAPFFCAMMTASNHAPIVIPDYFKSSNDNESEKVIQYADWSIGQFLKNASKQKWFQNTIFVFVADHGASSDKTYEMSLSYNHIPLFFYAPFLLKKPEVKKDFVKQIDIIPSLLDLTNISYNKNNFGINIWKEKRPFAFFSADDKIGIINDEFFLIYRKDGAESLFRYRKKDLKNYAKQFPLLVQEMKEYAFSNLQSAHVIKDKLK